jgi:hypothetical protein
MNEGRWVLLQLVGSLQGVSKCRLISYVLRIEYSYLNYYLKGLISK